MRVRTVAMTAAVLALGALGASPALADENTAPIVTGFSADPSPVSHEGGTVTFSVGLDDPDGIQGAAITVYLVTGGQLGTTLEPTAVDESGVGTWTGQVAIPSNWTNDPVHHSVEISATDGLGAVAVEGTGGIDVNAQPQFNDPPSVSWVQASPTYLDPAGGSVTISASATDNSSITDVVAYIGDQQMSLSYTGGQWEGQWYAPSNSGSSDVSWPISVTAYDDGGLSASAGGAQVTVAGVQGGSDNPPAIQSVLVTPSDLPAEGGDISIVVQAVDDYGFSMSYADVFSGDQVFTVGLLYAGEANGSSQFTGSFTIPANDWTDPREWGVAVTITDWAGGFATGSGSVTVAGAPPVEVDQSAEKLGFGTVDVGKRKTMSVTLTNADPEREFVGTIGAPNGPFRVVGSHGEPVPLTLAAGDSVTLTVRYRPENAREHKRTLRVTPDGGGEDLSVLLRGRGRR